MSILENNIRKWRRKRNISAPRRETGTPKAALRSKVLDPIDKMGELLGLGSCAVRHMELFAKKKPPQERLEKMAEVLRVSVDDLWKE